MKRLLYTAGAISLIGLIAYFNLDNILNWRVAQKNKEYVSPKLDTPYIKGQYIISFPKDTFKARLFRDSLLFKRFRQINACNCDASLTLWVAPDPETVPPDMLIQSRKILIPNQKDTAINQMQQRIRTAEEGSVSHNYLIVQNPPLPYNRFLKPPSKPVIPPLTNGPQVIVAIVDTGVDPEQEGLGSFLLNTSGSSSICRQTEGSYGLNMLNSSNSPSNVEPRDRDARLCLTTSTDGHTIWCSYRHGHGTLINGIIAGLADYPNRPTVPPQNAVTLKLLNVKYIEQSSGLSGQQTQGDLFKALCGIHYALDRGAKVINASWHVVPIPPSMSTEIRNIFSATLTKLRSSNAHLVTSAGNNGSSTEIIYPATFSRDPIFGDYVIAVGAWNNNTDTRLTTSNSGNFVDVYAPGCDITMYHPLIHWWSCTRYQAQAGTSFATPFVAREVAITKGLHASFPASQVKSDIISSSALVSSNRVFSPTQ